MKIPTKIGRVKIYLKHKVKNIGTTIKKNPKKSLAFAAGGVAGLSYLSYKDYKNVSKEMKQKLISHVQTLPKSDPLYKSYIKSKK